MGDFSITDIAQGLNHLLLQLFSVLPDSPFGSMLRFSDDYQLLGLLNYFIPFDVAAELMSLWLTAVVGYYAYCFFKGTLTVKNKFLDSVIKFFM